MDLDGLLKCSLDNILSQTFAIHHSVFYCLRWILILSSDLHLGGQSCLFCSYLPTIIAKAYPTGITCATFAACVILSVCLLVRLSFHPSVRPFFRPPIRPTIHPLVKTSTCPTTYPSTHLSNHKSTYLSVCLHACLSVLTPTNQLTYFRFLRGPS